jgi:DNA recombination protein Rad52
MSDHTTNDIAARLQEAPPQTALRTRQQGRASLTYLEGWWVIDQLNDIFQHDGWSDFLIGEPKVLFADWIQGKNGKRFLVSMQATVKIVIHSDVCGQVEHADVGYGDGTVYNHSGIADAYELAGKEAVTDALKRAARKLGNRLGNILYDKAYLHSGHSASDTLDQPQGGNFSAPRESQPNTPAGQHYGNAQPSQPDPNAAAVNALKMQTWKKAQKVFECDPDAATKAIIKITGDYGIDRDTVDGLQTLSAVIDLVEQTKADLQTDAQGAWTFIENAAKGGADITTEAGRSKILAKEGPSA